MDGNTNGKRDGKMNEKLIALLIAGGIGAYIIWQMMADGENGNGNGEDNASITSVTISRE